MRHFGQVKCCEIKHLLLPPLEVQPNEFLWFLTMGSSRCNNRGINNICKGHVINYIKNTDISKRLKKNCLKIVILELSQMYGQIIMYNK